MKTSRIGVLFSLGLILAAALTYSASASATMQPQLRLDEGSGHVAVTPGQEVRMVTESPITFSSTDNARTVVCPDQSDFSGFFGKAGTRASLVFESGGFMFGENCNSNWRFGSSATVEPLNFPWTLKAAKTGVVTVKGTPTVAIELTFYPSEEKCIYSAKAIKGKLVPAPQPLTEQQVDVRFTEAKLKRAEGSGIDCDRGIIMVADFAEVIGTSEYLYDTIS